MCKLIYHTKTYTIKNVHICGNYINIFIRCTIRNQHDILKTLFAYVSKVQIDMSDKGELQTLTKLSMRHQVCPSETCCVIISESIITMLMSRGRSNCGDTYYNGHKNLNQNIG